MEPKQTGKIRKALKNDLPYILEIENLSFEDPFTRDLFEDISEDASNIFLVFEVGQVVVGYAIASVETDNWSHILSLAVHPDHRQEGAGTALLLSTLGILSGRSCTGAYLECRRSNLVAQQLYEKLGFHRAGIVHLYYRNEDAVLYCKKL